MKPKGNLKQKAEYYWTYYKWHAAIILLIAAAAVYVISAIVQGKQSDPYTIYVVNQYLDSGQKDEIVEDTAKILGKETEEILLDDSVELDPENLRTNAVTGGAEKITTEYFAGGLDVLIAPENVVNYYQELGGIKETIPLKGNTFWNMGEDYYFCVMKSSGHLEETEVLIQNSVR